VTRLQISTVTYLTHDGSPTIVLDCTADTQYGKVKQRDISRAWVSFPSPLKHMSFDGRLLHGAPALQQLRPDAVRVTFLANVRLRDACKLLQSSSFIALARFG
jgi:hypothetical protein